MQDELPLEERVGSLAASAQQLVEIAKALGRQTKILVLDEPTSRLSLDDRSRLFSLMRKVAASGTAVLFISHFLEEVLGVADCITVLRDGRVVGQGQACMFSVASVSALMMGETEAVEREPAVSSKPGGAGAGNVLLAADGITCGWQVSNATLEVRAGEIVGLAGVVGSGRSSFARALVGAERLREGTVRLRGRAVRFRSPKTRERRASSWCLKTGPRPGWSASGQRGRSVALMALSGDAVRYGLVRRRDVRRRVAGVVKDFEVRPLDMSLAAATFSGGNQQKLLLARAILGKPDVLIVDGPTIGVDVGARAQVHRILRTVAESGSGVLMISDDVDEIAALSDRVLVMRRGAIIGEFKRQEIEKVSLVSIMSAGGLT